MAAGSRLGSRDVVAFTSKGLGEQVISSRTRSPEPCEFTSLSLHLKELL